MTRRSRCFVVVVLLCALAPAARSAAPPAAPQGHPNFSGEWVLDLTSSRLDKRLAGISSGVVTIDHREPQFSLSRTFVEKAGDSSVSFTLNTDGKEVAGVADGMPVRQTVSWSGKTLVFVTIFEAPKGEARNTVRYSLLDEGGHACGSYTGCS